MITELFDSFKSLTFYCILAAFVLTVLVVAPLRQSMFGRFGSLFSWSIGTDKPSSTTETPMELLTELYNKGKITKSEFETVKKDLELYVNGKTTKDEFDAVKKDLELYASDKSSKNKLPLFKKT